MKKILTLLVTIISFAQLSYAMQNPGWSTFPVAVVQYPLEGSLSVHQMFNKVKGYVERASVRGTKLIVLPELFSLDVMDFHRPNIPQFEEIAKALFPEFVSQLQKLAIDANIYLLAGSIPVENPVSKKIRNRSYLFAPDQQPVFQDKIFLTPDEVEWGWEAGDTINIIHAPWGTTAITICYDSEFPLISHTLANHVVDVILIPSMTGESGFTRVRWAAQTRAVEHMGYVLLTGTMGNPAPGWVTHSQGVILGPSLENFTPIIAEGEKDAAGSIVYANLNMTQLREAKATGNYYPALNQRDVIIEESYSQI
jgi:predicted amidohydrolase